MDDIQFTDPSLSCGIYNKNEIPDFKETTFGLLAGATRIGGRHENQDSFGYSETKNGLLIVVCDGMGGAKGGKFASQLAVDTIIQAVENSDLISKTKILVQALARANEIIYRTSQSRKDVAGMGTTAVALLIDDEKATIAHIGDSRIYQIRDRRKVFRTFDHSMVFELVKRGTISEEQARLSAESNVILRAIGTKPEIDIEVNHDLPYLKGDRFLLCTDGICGAMVEDKLIKLIATSKDTKETAQTIADTIDKVGGKSGGNHDNLTAALIQMNINSKLKPKMDKKSKIIIGIVSFLLIISLSVNWHQATKTKEGSTNDWKAKMDTITNSNKALNEKVKSLVETIKKDSDTVSALTNTLKCLNDSIQKIKRIETPNPELNIHK